MRQPGPDAPGTSLLARGSPHDDLPPVVRPQDDPVAPRSRPGAGGAGEPDLAEERRQEDLHLVQRKWHPQTDSVAAAEGEPLVRAELPLQEPLGAEAIGAAMEDRRSLRDNGPRGGPAIRQAVPRLSVEQASGWNSEL